MRSTANSHSGRRRLGRIARVVLSAVLLALLARRVDPGELWGVLLHVRPGFYLLAVAVALANACLQAFRWKISLHREPVPYRDLIRVHMIGYLFNSLFITGLGADIFKIGTIGGEGRGRVYVAGSVVMTRGANLLAALWISTFLALVLSRDLPARGIILGTSLAIHCGLAVVAGLSFWSGAVRFMERIPMLGRFVRVFMEYRDRPLTAALLVLTGLVFQTISVCAHLCLAKSLGIHIDVAYYLYFVPTLVVVVSLPITYGGFGIREMGLVHFLAPLGTDAPEATMMGLLSFSLWVALAFIGIVPLLIGRWISAGPTEREPAK